MSVSLRRHGGSNRAREGGEALRNKRDLRIRNTIYGKVFVVMKLKPCALFSFDTKLYNTLDFKDKYDII